MGAVTVGASAPTGNWTRAALGVNVEGKRVRRFILTGSATYATGGDTLSPAAVGLDRVEAVLVEATDAQLDTARKIGDRGVSFDCSNISAPKMIVRTAANTELGNGLSATGATVAAWVIGL